MSATIPAGRLTAHDMDLLTAFLDFLEAEHDVDVRTGITPLLGQFARSAYCILVVR